MKRIILCLLTTFLSLSLYAQSIIQYNVDLDQIHHHELRISIEFPALGEQALVVRMPQSSPGRYAIHNFAKNVYSVKATDSQGNELKVTKTEPTEWQVSGHDGSVTFEYTLFGNHGDGTYTGIDNRKLHLNMPATFIYGVGMEDRPVQLTFDLSDHPDWKVATQLKKLSETEFWAPDYYYFFDSPTFVGPIDFRSWTSRSNGKEYTIEAALLHEGTDEEFDDYVEWMKKIVEEQKSVYGSLPDYDFGKYTFLLAYNPWVYGDGMEHRNSTICSSQGSLAQAARGLIGTVSHEFFHCWNVERIRPNSLEPFDFDKANMSGELWFAEGFTSYYDDLTLCRTGITTPENYARGLSGTLNYVINFPGRDYRSPIEMSRHAPFVDAATAVDEDNHANTFISYYSYGSVLALALDLRIRLGYEGKTLDDVMKYLWENYGKPEIPYEVPDLQKAVGEVTGDKDFAQTFFDLYIYDSQLPNIQKLLSEFGIILSQRFPDEAQIKRLSVEFNEKGAQVRGLVLKGTALYKAGLNQGDIITAINGTPITSEEDYKKVVDRIKVGNAYSIKYLQNGIPVTSSFTAQQNPTLEVLLDEDASAEAVERRKAWLKIN